MARRRKKRRAGLPLPWERGVGGVREVMFGRKMRPAAALVVLAAALFGFHRLGKRDLDRKMTLAAIYEVRRATHAFVVDMRRCPHSPGELIHPPKSGVHYLSSVPTDAWGRELSFHCSLDGRPVVTVLSAGLSGSLLEDDNLP